MNDDSKLEELSSLIEAFTVRAREELGNRLSRWTIDLTRQTFHEVIGALLARQVTLAEQLARCPQNWTGHIAPLVLRAMADVYITPAWVLRDPADRSKKFIYYGLGQAKLEMEHRRAELETRDANEGEREYLEAAESWI